MRAKEREKERDIGRERRGKSQSSFLEEERVAGKERWVCVGVITELVWGGGGEDSGERGGGWGGEGFCESGL